MSLRAVAPTHVNKRRWESDAVETMNVCVRVCVFVRVRARVMGTERGNHKSGSCFTVSRAFPEALKARILSKVLV